MYTYMYTYIHMCVCVYIYNSDREVASLFTTAWYDNKIYLYYIRIYICIYMYVFI